MNFNLNTKTLKYLSSLDIPSSTRIIITNLTESLYDNQSDRKQEISKDLLRYLLTGYFGEIIELKGNNIVHIFENNAYSKRIYSQIIQPIKDKSKKVQGCIILINTKHSLDEVSINFISIIKHNIELYTYLKNSQSIKKFESNPIYEKNNIKDINSVIEEHLKYLCCSENYKRIEKILYSKIETLKENISKKNSLILDQILKLLEERKEYYAMFAIALNFMLNKSSNEN